MALAVLLVSAFVLGLVLLAVVLRDDTDPSAEPPPAPQDPAASEVDDPSVEGVVFPDEDSTGVPEGTVLKMSGPVVVTEDGAVIDSLDIEGSISVEADDVTIARTLVRGEGRYAIHVESGATGLVVEDTEIDGTDITSAAVCCSRYTLTRVDIHSAPEGPRAGSDVTIQDSYIHHLRRCVGRSFDEGCHVDAIQSTDGSNIRIRNNNLQAYNPDTDDPKNAAYMFGEDLGDLTDVLFEGNLVNGGMFAINGGGAGTEGAQVTIRNNRFGRDFRYAPAGNLGPKVQLDDTNVYDDTGQPIVDDVE